MVFAKVGLQGLSFTVQKATLQLALLFLFSSVYVPSISLLNYDAGVPLSNWTGLFSYGYTVIEQTLHYSEYYGIQYQEPSLNIWRLNAVR